MAIESPISGRTGEEDTRNRIAAKNLTRKLKTEFTKHNDNIGEDTDFQMRGDKFTNTLKVLKVTGPDLGLDQSVVVNFSTRQFNNRSWIGFRRVFSRMVNSPSFPAQLSDV